MNDQRLNSMGNWIHGGMLWLMLVAVMAPWSAQAKVWLSLGQVRSLPGGVIEVPVDAYADSAQDPYAALPGLALDLFPSSGLSPVGVTGTDATASVTPGASIPTSWQTTATWAGLAAPDGSSQTGLRVMMGDINQSTVSLSTNPAAPTELFRVQFSVAAAAVGVPQILLGVTYPSADPQLISALGGSASAGSVVDFYGVVKDGNNAAVAGVQVWATEVTSFFTQSTVTDSNGKYAFINMPAGNYQLEFVTSYYDPNTNQAVNLGQIGGFLTANGGGVTSDFALAGTFPVTGAGTAMPDAILQQAVTISGTVTQGGNGVANAVVNIHDPAFNSWFDGVTDANGAFSIPVDGTVSGYVVEIWPAMAVGAPGAGGGGGAPSFTGGVYVGTNGTGSIQPMSPTTTPTLVAAPASLTITVAAPKTLKVGVYKGTPPNGTPVANAWVDADGFGGATDQTGVATIAIDSALTTINTLSVWPGFDANGRFDTSFAGGFVANAVGGGYTLVNDVQQAVAVSANAPVDVYIAQSFVVDGYVQLKGSAAGVANAWVSLDDSYGNSTAGGMTDQDGYFSLPAQNGSYTLSVWSDLYAAADPVPVTVSNGNVRQNITLSSGVTVAGVVRDQATGRGIGDMWVEFHSTNGQIVNGTTTGPDGSYTIQLASGVYIAVVYGWDPLTGQQRYRDNYYQGAASEAAATPIDLTQVQSMTGIDFAMSSGAAISGKIAGLQHANDIVWIDVWSDAANSGGGARVVGNGTFTITGLQPASDYKLSWWADGYLSGTLGRVNGVNAIVPWDQALLLDTTAGAVDVGTLTMSTGNVLTVNISGGVANSAVEVGVWSDAAGSGDLKVARFDNAGAAVVDLYGIGGIDNRLHVRPIGSGLKGGYYQADGTLGGWDTAQLLDLSAGNKTVSVALSAGGSVSGTVSGLSNGEEAWLDIFSESTGAWAGTQITGTGNGPVNYTLDGLDYAPDYKLSITSDKRPGGFYGAAAGLVDWDQAVPINIYAQAANVTGIDIALPTAVSISGTVTGLQKGDVAWIDAWSDRTFAWGGTRVQGGGTTSDAWTIGGLKQASDYTVSMTSEKYLDQSFGGVSAPYSQLSFTASTGGSVLGVISGLPKHAWAWVDVLDAYGVGGGVGIQADGAGSASYKVDGLADGSYQVSVSAPSGFYFYGSPYATVDPAQAATVTIANGGNATANIDLSQTTTYSISGTVTLQGVRNAYAAVQLYAWSDTGGWGFAERAGSGTYTIRNLVAGSYYLSAVTDGVHEQFLQSDGYSWAESMPTAAPLTVNGDIAGKDVTLTGGVVISGQVTDGQGAPVAGVMVVAWDPYQNIGGSAKSDGAGNYAIKGLVAGGSYAVDVWAGDQGEAHGAVNNISADRVVNLQLVKQTGAITGTTTAGVTVFVFDSTGTYVAATVADAGGAFTIGGLANGTYTVKSDVNNDFLLNQNDKTTTVTVNGNTATATGL